VVTNYRLTPEVVHPGHIQDIARAFAWTYRNITRYGGDPERIFLGGHSAGGHLAALLALDERYLAAEGLSPELVRGVIGISGVYDLNAIPGFEAIFGADPEARRDASPIAHIAEREELPPFLLLYAQFDLPGLAEQAQEFAAALRAYGGVVDLKEISRRDHVTIIGLIGRPGDPTTAAMLDFLHRTL